MNRIEIRTRNGVYRAELEESELSDALWISLPRESTINVWGSEIYFELPVDVTVRADSSVLDVGDIAYWPEGKAICLFFGPTPLSSEEGRPVPIRPVKRIGRLIGDISGLERVGDRTRVVIDRSF
ncbi:MAG: uncharacterized protein PWQ88_624 [Candidatus Methanomethylophilaceae archaeon]|nr:uncharacterized protein [Candidatus Methanomethylophilaceae archaeon]MDI3541541.1 uncharacterized protein [Candidatus Methanomethylophilaceae archaeon]